MKKAYGRLDIFWPDGRVETALLTDDVTDVGRLGNSQVVVDHDGVDASHLRLSRTKQGAMLHALTQKFETFVDGVGVKPGTSVPLNGGEEIQLGSLRVVFRVVDDTPTLPMIPAVDDTQRIVSESAPFRIELQLPHITVVPGAYISVELSVSNTGRESERYTIDVQGVPQSWVRVNRPSVVVDSGDTSLVMINLRPIRHSDSRPGNYPVQVTVTPDRDPRAALRAMLTVRIQPFNGLGIALSASRVNSGSNFRLHLHNHGSASLALRLTAQDTHGKLNLRLSQTFAQLGPGERIVVGGSAALKEKRAFGADVEHAFVITAHADAQPYFTVAVPGKVVDHPPLPAWSRLAAAAGALLAILLIAYGVWGLLANRTVTPVITTFAAQPTEVVRGQPVELTWDVRDAQRIALIRDGGEPQVLDDPDAGSWTIDSNILPSLSTFVLIAMNGSQQVDATVQVSVYTPAVVETLSVQPGLVFRNVIQDLTIRWSAMGFSGTPVLRGLESLGLPPEIPLAPEQTALSTGPILPQTDFTVRIVVMDERGTEVERTEDVRLTDPQCTTVRGDVPLLTAPDDGAAVLMRLPPGVASIVDGRTSAGDFLTVQIDNGATAWAHTEDFVCPTDLFRVMDLREVVVAPFTPAPTVTREPPPLTIVPTTLPTQTPTNTPTSPPPSATPSPLPTASATVGG